MKKFIVTESSTPDFKLKEFEIHTQIRQIVTLPFSNEEYRCVIFDGIFVRLVTDNDFIIGVNV